MHNQKQSTLSVKYSWRSLFEAAFVVAYLYVFLEWVFIVTKPSFFVAVSLWQKLRIFLFTASLLAGAMLAGMALLFLLAGLFRWPAIQNILKRLGVLGIAFILASLGLLLVDNFTYTIFQFGIISTRGFTTLLYLIGFLALLIYTFTDIQKTLAGVERFLANKKFRKVMDIVFLGILLASFLLNFERPESVEQEVVAATQQRDNLPDILLITSDGLNADNLSAYGYERDTTPRIKELVASSLVAENAFNNSGKTLGSILSFYTGKYPTRTRVLYSPDILKGKDSFQHLPGILKTLGYYNVQYTYPNHADAFSANLLSGFDEANGVSVQQNVVQNQLSQYVKTDYAYFFYEIANRIVDRLRHVFFNKKMVNQQDIVEGNTHSFDDQQKIDSVLGVVRSKEQPVFAHIHWMGTHGRVFVTNNRTYSAAKDAQQQADWDVDFYDDSIIDFDAAVGQIIDGLRELGAYDNTILVIGSDHSQNYFTEKRIPLIMHFPSNQHSGTVQSNVQNIDLAPTLLDYLGVDRPVWMDGASILDGNPGNRPIFGVSTGEGQIKSGRQVASAVKPPFYQFGYISVVYCDHWYRLGLMQPGWKTGQVAGSSAVCPGVADATVYGWMHDRLEKDGFDVSSLVMP
jgi:arylsulfatase A-like enzyme